MGLHEELSMQAAVSKMVLAAVLFGREAYHEGPRTHTSHYHQGSPKSKSRRNPRLKGAGVCLGLPLRNLFTPRRHQTAIRVSKLGIVKMFECYWRLKPTLSVQEARTGRQSKSRVKFRLDSQIFQHFPECRSCF